MHSDFAQADRAFRPTPLLMAVLRGEKGRKTHVISSQQPSIRLSQPKQLPEEWEAEEGRWEANALWLLVVAVPTARTLLLKRGESEWAKRRFQK